MGLRRLGSQPGKVGQPGTPSPGRSLPSHYTLQCSLLKNQYGFCQIDYLLAKKAMHNLSIYINRYYVISMRGLGPFKLQRAATTDLPHVSILARVQRSVLMTPIQLQSKT